MAGGALLISQIDQEQEAANAREQARASLAQPAPSPDEAASVMRDSATIGISPEMVYQQPATRREAQAVRDWDTVGESPRLQRYLTENEPEAAAAARDDFDVMREIENVLDDGGRRWAQGRQEQARREAGADWNGAARQVIDNVQSSDWWNGVERNVERSARQLRDNLADPQWWHRQAEAVNRNARENADATGRFLNDAGADIATQYEVGRLTQEQADLGWRAIEPGGVGLSEVERARLDELQAMDHPDARTWVGTAAQSLPMMLSSFGEGARQAGPGAAAGFTFGAIAAAAGGQAGPQVAAPEEIVTVPALALSGAGLGARTGFTYGTALQAGRQEAGLAYAEFRQMRDNFGNPIDDDVARMAALGVGGVNGLLEVASLRATIRALPGGDAMLSGMTRARMRQLLMRPTFREALLKAAGRVLYVGATEGATETLQEATTIIGGNLAAAADGRTFERPTLQEAFGRAMNAGVGGFQAGTVFGAFGAGTGLAWDIPRARRAEQDVAVIDALASASERSNLRRRLPERFHAWVDQVTADGPLDTIWIDAAAFRTFFQAQEIDPAQVADALEGVGRAQYEQAVAARDDIAVPIATFATRIAGTPAYQALREHMRLHPEADTIAEAKANFANEESVRGRLEEIIASDEARGDTIEAEQVIARDLGRRLDLAAVTVSDANRVKADAIARAIVVTAEKGGANPIEIYRRFFADLRGPFDQTPGMRTRGDRAYQAQGPLDVDAFTRRVQAEHGLADLRITRARDGDLVLDVMGVSKRDQRKGRGSAAMADIAAYADEHGLRLRVTPPKRGGAFGTTSQARAREFLSRHGFVENKGARKDAAIGEAMYRPPTGQRRLDQTENPTGTPRIDTRAIDPAGGLPMAGIPEIGSAEFAILVEAAHEKLDAGKPLSYLEDYAVRTERAAMFVTPGVSREYFSREEGGEAEPRRAGPLPPRAAEEAASAQQQLVGLTGEQRERMSALLNQRDALAREIEQRMEAERDLPSVEAARKDAAAMRAAAYCSAREVIRNAARIAKVGGAIGSTAAAALAVATAGNATDTTDGSLPAPPEAQAAETAEAPSNVVAIPPPVELPEADAEAVMAELPAAQAETAVAPERLSQASARAAETDPDLPITTNNKAEQ